MSYGKQSDVTETAAFVFFWSGWPSQWHRCRFVVDGVPYNCAEQFMMAEKAALFGDFAAQAKILAATNPREQKALGRTVRGFDAATWAESCREIVYTGNVHKFTQNGEFRRLLLATGDRRLVEASPDDAVWGIGLPVDDPRAHDVRQWQGTNWLGEALDRVREDIR